MEGEGQCERDNEDTSLLAVGLRKGHVPRNAGSLWKLEKARKWLLPQSLQKECCVADIFTVAQS